MEVGKIISRRGTLHSSTERRYTYSNPLFQLCVVGSLVLYRKIYKIFFLVFPFRVPRLSLMGPNIKSKRSDETKNSCQNVSENSRNLSGPETRVTPNGGRQRTRIRSQDRQVDSLLTGQPQSPRSQFIEWWDDDWLGVEKGSHRSRVLPVYRYTNLSSESPPRRDGGVKKSRSEK